MKYIISIMLILSFISIQLIAGELNKVTIGIEVYDTIINSTLEGDYLYSTDQFISVKSGIELGLTKDLSVTFNSVVYGFAIKIFGMAPSSVDFQTIFDYDIDSNLVFRYKHRCWHYFKQFPENLGIESDSFEFTYEFGQDA